MTCKLTKLCMEKLLQVAELGGSNGQRNFSCTDGHPPDIGKCANSCTFPCIMAGMMSRNLQEAYLFSFFGLEIPLQNGAMARIWPFVPLAAARQ